MHCKKVTSKFKKVRNSKIRKIAKMVLKIMHIVPFFHGGVGKVALNLTKEFVKMGS